MARNNKITRIYICEMCGGTTALTGSGRPRKYCAACKQKAYKANAKAKYVPKGRKLPTFPKKLEYVRLVKLAAVGCVDCGYEMNERTIVCFDFDHRDPAKKRFEVSRPPTWATKEDVDDEIAKCDIVCRNCHALRPTSRLGRYRRPQLNQLPLGNLFEIAQ